MTQFQVKVKNEDESRRVQEALFQLGYHWDVGGMVVTTPRLLDKPVLLCMKSGEIRFQSLSAFVDGDPTNQFPIAVADKIIAFADRRKASGSQVMKKEKDDAALPVGTHEGQGPMDGDFERMARDMMSRPEVQEAVNNLSAALSNLGLAEVIPQNLRVGLPEEDSRVQRKSLLEAAEKTLNRLGYEYKGGEEWVPPLGKEKTFEEFWVVWNPSHGSPRKKHPSKGDARMEAERLSSKQPGEPFFVLRSEGLYESVAMVESYVALARAENQC